MDQKVKFNTNIAFKVLHVNALTTIRIREPKRLLLTVALTFYTEVCMHKIKGIRKETVITLC